MSAPALYPQRESSIATVKSLGNQPRGTAGASVLITDEHYKHTLGIVRHLGQQGANVSVVASSKDSLVCRSRYCREVVLSPKPTVDAFVATTIEAVRRRNYDLVIPVSYPMTLALARQREQLLPYTHLELTSATAIEQAANKLLTAELAKGIGVPVPKIFHSSCFGELNGQLNDLTFPVVLKPGKESPGRSRVRYANNIQELQELFRQNRSTSEPLLLQEFIPGYGCGFFATYQEGTCKRIFMHRRVREYPATGGVSSCAESFYDAKLEDYGRRMLDALNWHGVAMVEFRHDSRDGEFKLMEINPKFWGSLDLALAAGADFPSDLCHMALGRTLPFSGDYDRNLRFQWPFSGHGELFHLWTRPQSVFNVMKDFLSPRVKSNVSLSDFRPNVRELFGLFGKLFRTRKD
jgi:predicted ATP-grasp superfamily ATP-dependent carboligase